MDNIVVRVLFKIFDLILLNILWILFSLPIITIGASTTALYSVTMKCVLGEEGYIVSDYYRAFRKNLKKSTIVFMVLMLTGCVLLADLRITINFHGSMMKYVLFEGILIVCAVYIFELVFIFPVISINKASLWTVMKNALVIPVKHLPVSLIVIACAVGSFGATLINRMTIMFGGLIWSFIGIALVAYVQSFFLVSIFSLKKN